MSTGKYTIVARDSYNIPYYYMVLAYTEETAREMFDEANTGKIIEYCYPMPSNITYSTVKQITPDVFEVR
ncbi:hypothetical protein [Ruthenibacterium lactatiformans]|uniref:hypothetical protein n=1 Tax=Ruthenibacterium lactatiformans TaxID=1550024 RepID=UPI0039A24018